jgi:very-short-patch-repair endonuclease
LWKGAPSSSFEKAKALRMRETKSEKILWDKLKNNQLDGLKFRRQHPISLYIADFYCHKFKLIIELDGKYHEEKEQKIKDQERDEVLKLNGLNILRFKNEEVEKNIDNVLIKIKNHIKELKIK